MLEAKPQAVDAPAKIPTPIRNILRRPNRSPSAPPARMIDDKTIPYDSTIHCTSTTLAWKVVCNVGTATLTTVLSMNAMLEPRIVAARIQGPLVAVRGTHNRPNAITLWSHGVLTKIRMPCSTERVRTGVNMTSLVPPGWPGLMLVRGGDRCAMEHGRDEIVRCAVGWNGEDQLTAAFPKF